MSQDYKVSFLRKGGSRPNTTDIRQQLERVLEEMCSLRQRVDRKASWGYPYNTDRLEKALTRVMKLSSFRTICAPNDQIKEGQSRILRRLERIPLHRNAHGFVKGRCPMTCANAHLEYWGKRDKGLVLLNCDIKDFFHSISEEQVRQGLLKHDFHEKEVDAMTRMCMAQLTPDFALSVLKSFLKFTGVRVPVDWMNEELTLIATDASDYAILKNDTLRGQECARILALIVQKLLGLREGIKLGDMFLPQGAPTSPAISNIVCKLIDIRLTAMAKAFGGFYTRYADDLTVSWPAFTKGKVIDGMRRCSVNVINEYGFQLNKKKIHIMGPAIAQNVVGYCINSGRPTISQKFRREVKDAIRNERKSSKPTTDRRIMVLHGLASHVQTAHPAEAGRMREQIEGLHRKTNRRVLTVVPEYDGAIESPEETPKRKIGAGVL